MNNLRVRTLAHWLTGLTISTLLSFSVSLTRAQQPAPPGGTHSRPTRTTPPTRRPGMTGKGNPSAMVRVNIDLQTYGCIQPRPLSGVAHGHPGVHTGGHPKYHFKKMTQSEALAQGYRPRKGHYCP